MVKKDKSVQFNHLTTNTQSVEVSFGAAPDFPGKSEAMEMLGVCKDVIRDCYDDAKEETERAQKACKAFQDDNKNGRPNKAQDSLMLQAAKMIQPVDGKMTVDELRKMLLSNSVILHGDSVSHSHHSDWKTIIDSCT